MRFSEFYSILISEFGIPPHPALQATFPTAGEGSGRQPFLKESLYKLTESLLFHDARCIQYATRVSRSPVFMSSTTANCDVRM